MISGIAGRVGHRRLVTAEFHALTGHNDGHGADGTRRDSDPSHANSCRGMSYCCGMTRTPARRLAEVAQKVGVSEATVSRVLNGKAGVSDSTREAVLTALDVLGYERPTQLRGDRARLIGLVLPELQNPIFPALAEVIGGALAQRGFTPVLCTRTGRRAVGGRLRRHAARPARLRSRVRGRPLRRAGRPA